MIHLLFFESYISNIVKGQYLPPRDVTNEIRALYQDCIQSMDNESEIAKKKKVLAKFLNNNKGNTIKLYHGTSSKNPIMEDGILRTTNRTKKSLQSEPGYVYLSFHKNAARTFGEIAYPGHDVTVYEVNVPIGHLKPDTDQLRNQRYWSGKDVKDTLVDSLLYGNGFRVKGDIPPYMLNK